MKRLRALRGLFACVGCMPRCTRREARGREASPVPACAVTLLLQRLQDQEGDRVQVYCELESVLWEDDDGRPPCGVVNRLLAEVSQDLTAAQVRGHSQRQREPPAHTGVLLADVVKQWSEGVKFHLSSGQQCPWPAIEKEQICENLYQLFCSVLRNWQDCKEEKDKQTILGAVAAMMAVLLQEELHQEHVWEQLLWLVHQYQEVQDTCRGTKSLSIFLEALKGVETVIPKDKFLAITSAVFYQVRGAYPCAHSSFPLG
ncbi:uncharacterized protein LOC107324845 [Coturnix japonica]|uniref:uncharacterized protein LOC107324845 n=1 Tax=Coturnix japonica TaxID=93934 RepID=UPI0013A5EA1E|nr:uncharacterized protein LOC107324845 [Coturnix japonica]